VPADGRSAVLAPGGNNNTEIPLLMYARVAVKRRGASARLIAWELAAGAGIDAQREMVAATDEPTVAALSRATAPFLLVGGTSDPYWDGRVARSVTAAVVEIDGADHSMLVPGRLSASAAVLGQVMTVVEDFLDRTVWP
jgi:pimeloyl-ACP methyl ester carboxylesterase